jgi:hypothetical protein
MELGEIWGMGGILVGGSTTSVVERGRRGQI